MKKTDYHTNQLKSELTRILYYPDESRNLDFYISALTEYNPFASTEEIEHWLRTLNEKQYFNVTQIPLSEMEKWRFDNWTGNLYHKSGGFFSICGLDVKTNNGTGLSWSQPIIHQPEVGILGIITKKIDGILYFLMQAKAEPGNINTFQISPTVQATRSNYLRLHGGKAIRFLDFFLDESKSTVLVDQLQSEQGARFYKKRNRNIIVRINDDDDLDLTDNFRWMTLGQILKLTQKNNCVNMDSRSIISAIDFTPEYPVSNKAVDQKEFLKCLEKSPLIAKPINEFGIKLMISSHPNTPSVYSMDDILMRLTKEKFKSSLETHLIPLNQVRKWHKNEYAVFHEDRKYFSIIGVRVETNGREVHQWDQPIIQQCDPGIVGFITREIEGVLHFLVQFKLECGVMDVLEMAPTIQCITDNYSDFDKPPYLEHIFMNNRFHKIVDVYQSEEGGRFYHEANQNILLYDTNILIEEQNSRYIFMSLHQLKNFLKFNNFLNVEARSLIASLEWK